MGSEIHKLPHKYTSLLLWSKESEFGAYILQPISRAFERLGYQSVIKSEVLNRTLPYQLKHDLQRLQQLAQKEYEEFICEVSKVDPVSFISV